MYWVRGEAMGTNFQSWALTSSSSLARPRGLGAELGVSTMILISFDISVFPRLEDVADENSERWAASPRPLFN